MDGVVSLLDDAHSQAVVNLWDALERNCGIKRLREVIPYPHVSYHVAGEYDLARLDQTLAHLAATTPPFVLRTAGLGVFTGAAPVLYLSVTRDPHLTRYHERVWSALAGGQVSTSALALYHPDRWMPHITLAQHDLDATNISEAVRLLAGHALAWEVPVESIAVLRHAPGERAEVWRRYTFTGS